MRNNVRESLYQIFDNWALIKNKIALLCPYAREREGTLRSFSETLNLLDWIYIVNKFDGEMLSTVWMPPKWSYAQIFKKGKRELDRAFLTCLGCILMSWYFTDYWDMIVTVYLLCLTACYGVLWGWVHHRPCEEHQREHTQRRLDSLYLQRDPEGKDKA